ncbi:9556_t:CDS:2 [Scutellospora calospora]|uniref:9556_t:CDS:1 n=1 Tax=Scutellospora calospora TaxID=85575 RepID=A0ACA9KR80_9GLOM|nr:9556_t:CDS:2 [Scutellospora calospora]
MYEEIPSVVHLALHLPGIHRIIFNSTINDATDILICADQQKTTLTAFFETCTTLEIAHQYTYQEFLQYFVWNKNNKKWTLRKNKFAISRLYFADLSAGERYYLWLLLTIVRSPQSFEHLKTVNSVLHSTFKDACIALGLLEDDSKWIYCLDEAVVMRSGSQLRSLFAMHFHANICNDLQYRLNNEYNICEPTEDQIYDFGLFLLDKILCNIFIYEQLNWNYNKLQNIANECIALLNYKQHIAYQDILNSIGNRTNISESDNMISISENMLVGPDLRSLIDTTYYDIFIENTCTDQYLRDWIILSSRNNDVEYINSTILDIFPGNK